MLQEHVTKFTLQTFAIANLFSGMCAMCKYTRVAIVIPFWVQLFLTAASFVFMDIVTFVVLYCGWQTVIHLTEYLWCAVTLTHSLQKILLYVMTNE